VFGPVLESSRLPLTVPRALHDNGENGARVGSWRGCLVRSLRGSSLRLVHFSLVGPSLQPVEVGSPLGMGCVIPQPYADVGNRSYPGVLGHNRQPTVPEVIYPDKFGTSHFLCCFTSKTLVCEIRTMNDEFIQPFPLFIPLDRFFQFTIDSDTYVGKCLILFISSMNVMLQLNNAPSNYL
jgi:hypothetical protein